MFNEDFYPTPNEVIAQMIGFTTIIGKVILEPSAGKGNIVDAMLNGGAKEVLACESESALRAILNTKCRVIENDFLNLTPDRISHVDMIVMNPPFSQMEKHIYKAWEIAPAGCEIIALCNESLFKNAFSKSRQELQDIVNLHGSKEDLGACFSDSERKTDVRITCIRLHKPNDSSNEFDGFFDMTEAEEYGSDISGLMSPNYILDIVSRYVDAVKMFDSVVESNNQMNDLISPIDGFLRISFGVYSTDRNGGSTTITRDTFRKELQKSAWRTIFSKLNMERYMTTGVKAKLNKYVEQQENVPFTMRNIFNMAEMIVGTSNDTMNQVLVEAFEKICSFSSENSTAGEKWKTNSDYMLNKRFIKPRVCTYDTRWPKQHVEIQSSGGDEFEDINKALCHLTGSNYDNYIQLGTFFRYKLKLQRKDGTLMGGYKNCFDSYDGYSGAIKRKDELFAKGIDVTIIETSREWGQWVDWGFFRVRGYKKGTMHFEFIDDKVLEMFNRKVAEIKGWRLPKSTKKAYRAKTEGVMVY